MSRKRNPDTSTNTKPTRKRSSTRYWRSIGRNLYARLQYTDEHGKPKEKLRRISKKKDAIAVLADMRRELDHSGEESLRSDRMTFDRLAQLFIESRLTPPVYANGIKVSGMKSRLRSMAEMLAAHFRNKPVRSVRPRDLERLKSIRLATPVLLRNKKGEVVVERPRSIATVNRELATLRMMFSFALQNDWILQNPFSRTKGVIVMSAERERDRVLGHDEEVRLLAQCVGKRAHLRPILICALDTAMRSGEMFKMRWRDIDFRTGEIFIPHTNTKTQRSRIVGVTPRLREELERLWDASSKHSGLLVFGITNNVKRSWKRVCSDAGVRDFRLHDCRHTATTRMIASGSPHTEVMKITGHSQISTFLRYLNVTNEAVNRTASRLSDYLSRREVHDHEISDSVN